jgi:UDPglucose 6-dehydrogenase
MQPLVGFIGQGWIGKQYADDFETRGFEVVRYALEAPYRDARDRIAECAIVFIAVPTPTTRSGFDASALRAVLPLIGEGRIAVIKSTLLPGTTEALQKEFPATILLHSPEFLRETSAAYDAAHPTRNIIGLPLDTEAHQKAARAVLDVLPSAPFTKIMPARTAELVKYSGNVFLALKVVYANLLYDLADDLDVDYETLRESLAADPRIGPSHLSPVAASGHSEAPGRGAGGHCFIKDLEAFRSLYAASLEDSAGDSLLDALVRKNNALLTASGKDLELLEGVYGTEHPLLP